MARREEVLDAAVAVLGERGPRHLTHRAVDAAAGVPAGTTSNAYRTRDALLLGVVRHVAARERDLWERLASTLDLGSPEALARGLAVVAHEAVTTQRAMTLARYAVFTEAARRPDLRAGLEPARAELWGWAAAWLARLGSPDPERDCRLLLNQLDGILLHQLTFSEPGFDPLPDLDLLVTRILRQPS